MGLLTANAILALFRKIGCQVLPEILRDGDAPIRADFDW